MLVDGDFHRVHYEGVQFESHIEEGTCGGHPARNITPLAPPPPPASCCHTPLPATPPLPATGTLALIRTKSHWGATLDVTFFVRAASGEFTQWGGPVH